MAYQSSKILLKAFVLSTAFACLMAGPPRFIPQSTAAPACPPACPPNPANCDSNLVISSTQSLSFGAMAALAAGTVTVDINSIRSASGGIVLIGGTVSAATFSMTTSPYSCTGRSLVVINVAAPAILTNGSGATMSVDNFVTSLVGGDAFDPAVPLVVGGTLNVGAMQAPGVYSGNIFITVTFQ